jgi:hypothetical protein
LEVEASLLATALQLSLDGTVLPTKQTRGEDGLVTVAVLENIVAGSSGKYCFPTA